jgi:epidermal growth factor receptor substrate 15
MVRLSGVHIHPKLSPHPRTLADTHKRGALDSTDFSVAMYLIQACMSGQLSFVPTSLPPGLYEQAAGKPLESVIAHSTGGSTGISPMVGSFNRPIQPQYTGQPLQPQSTGQRFAPPALPSRPAASTNAFMQPQFTGQPQWDVTAAEKANSDQHFDTLDTSRRGFVEGDVVVPFMLQSQLSEDILARIWCVFSYYSSTGLTCRL